MTIEQLRLACSRIYDLRRYSYTSHTVCEVFNYLMFNWEDIHIDTHVNDPYAILEAVYKKIQKDQYDNS